VDAKKAPSCGKQQLNQRDLVYVGIGLLCKPAFAENGSQMAVKLARVMKERASLSCSCTFPRIESSGLNSGQGTPGTATN
jgi:hypothetical protein